MTVAAPTSRAGRHRADRSKASAPSRSTGTVRSPSLSETATAPRPTLDRREDPDGIRVARHRAKVPNKLGDGIAVDSVSLIATSALTAGTGLVFWAIAARLIPPEELGIQTALLSLVTTAGTIAAVGTGNSFTALLPARNCDRRDRLLDGYAIVLILSIVLGFVAGLAGAQLVGEIPYLQVLGFVVLGTLAMAFFAVKDSAMIGLQQARRLPVQNLVVSLVKLALLPVCVGLVTQPAVFATLIPSALAALVVTAYIIPKLLARSAPLRMTSTTVDRSIPQRRDLAGFAFRDGIASSMTLGIVLALPFITTWIAGPVEGAMLALTLAISQGLDFVSIGVGTALTTDLSQSSTMTVPRVRKAWLLSFLVVAAGGTLVIAISSTLLPVFGSQYDTAMLQTILAVLVVGSVARVSYVIWTALLRAQRRTSALLRVNSTVSLFTLPAILLLTTHFDALGAAAGLASGSVLLGAFSAFALFRFHFRATTEGGAGGHD